MGLIKAALGAAGGVLADQWKEFFYCDALDKDVLVVRGQKQITKRSSNKKGNDNVISNGSGIAVADGQCMIIVDQGKVAEFCAEPGEYTWNNSSEPSIFTGKFGESVKKTFAEIGRRFTYGGDPGKDQRVYYFNTKELIDNKFGTATPIEFRVVDRRIGLDRDVHLRINGTYSYCISDPILFYTNVCGNVTSSYQRNELDGQLKAEFTSALMPAIGRMSELELRPNQLMAHTTELRNYLNEELTAEWAKRRGLSIVSVALGAVTLTEEDAEMLRQDQRAGMYRDPGLAAGMLSVAQADAMRTAAGNTNGAMAGFMGMGVAMNAGANTQNLYTMQQQQMAQQQAAAPADESNLSRMRKNGEWEILSRMRCQKACSADSRQLGVPAVRFAGKRKILSGMRCKKAGRIRSLDMFLRDGKQWKFLLQLWCQKTGRKADLPL